MAIGCERGVNLMKAKNETFEIKWNWSDDIAEELCMWRNNREGVIRHLMKLMEVSKFRKGSRIRITVERIQ